MSRLVLGVVQMACGADADANVARAEALAREAAARGANVVLLPELFETPYFCKDQEKDHFRLARPAAGHPVLARMGRLAAELGVVLPVSFFERAGQAHYNAVMTFDADGRALGVYRKSHIPDGPGYQEKFYFNPGDTGFKAWPTRFGRAGVGICWDQWFPEAARAMALAGAEFLLYPSAIGSEPQDPALDSRAHWRRTMQGHAAANMLPLAAANRCGEERGRSCSVTFYGSSFIAGPKGEIVAEAPGEGEAVLVHAFDREEIALARAAWGVFRDRRPDLYGVLATHDGGTRHD
jgi:N-carbamoylputrescine amidase